MNNIFEKAVAAAQNGLDYSFATIIRSTGKGTPRKTGAKMVVLEDGSLFGTIGGGIYEKEAQKACLNALKTRKTAILTFDYTSKSYQLCGGQIQVLVEPFEAPRHLIICGAGHIGLPLSALAKIQGFNVTVLDNRREFANRKRFPHIDKVICDNFSKALKKVSTNKRTYIMIATYGHAHDLECLKSVVNSNAAYIGVIASLQKRRNFMAKLKALKTPSKALKKLSIPAGIDIGAQTPQEIAVSIMAEIIAKNNRDFIGSKKFKAKK